MYRILNRNTIRQNITTVAIVIYVLSYGSIVYLKPSFLYNTDGSLREFGVGQSRKTILPAWLLSLVLSLMSYFSILYYLTAPKLQL